MVAPRHLTSDVVVGDVRIPYADEHRSGTGALIHSAGWVLPGGERTASYERAVSLATKLHMAMSMNKPPIVTTGEDDEA